MSERAVLYGRISREGGRVEAGTMRSDVIQEDATTEKAKARGDKIVAWDLDMDISGGLFQRAGFQRALDLFSTDEADVMIVPTLDRFGRDMKVIYKALEIIEEAGGYLVSIAEGIEDSRTQDGRDKIALFGFFAQNQLDRIKSGWVRAHKTHISEGIPSRVPWGYERDDTRRLAPTAVGREWVPQVFAWRGEGMALTTIADRLNGAEVTTRTGSQWRQESIGIILKNRTYLGQVSYGELVNPDAHEPLVSLAAWHKAQVSRPVRASVKTQSLLAGLILCASCRYAMDYKKATATRNASYQCTAKHGAGRCPGPVSVPAAQVDQYVRTWATDEMLNEGGGLMGDGSAPPELIRAAEDSTAAVTLFLADETREARLGTERYNEQLDRLLAHETEAKAALEDATTDAVPFTAENPWVKPIAVQRALLRSGVDCLFVRGRPGRGKRTPIDGRVHICKRGDGPKAEDLPRRGDGGARYIIAEFVFPDEADALPLLVGQ